MTREEILRLIDEGEKINVEFKRAHEALTKDVFDTVCSFNNRSGGHIILGVGNDKKILGIEDSKITKIIKDFTTSVNNPKKLYPPLYLTPELVTVDDKKLLYIRVPEGHQVCRHNAKIWDRSYEGDIDITNNSELVFKLYARKRGSFFVNKVYPNLELDALDEKLIES